MAIYRLSVSTIGRKSGGSAIGAAAYRAAECITDLATGKTHDYRNKQNVDGSLILVPNHSPDWARDRSQLWNAVEASEKRKDARLARECLVILPRELNHKQNRDLAVSFAQENFIADGMVADISWHGSNTHNPHAHILLTTRKISSNGFGKKEPTWNHKSRLIRWRKSWEHHANEAFEIAAIDQRIDHRSLKDQGINRLPQIHLGKYCYALEKKGIHTDKGNHNREIIRVNQRLEALEAEIGNLEKFRANLEKSIRHNTSRSPWISSPESEQNSEYPQPFNTRDIARVFFIEDQAQALIRQQKLEQTLAEFEQQQQQYGDGITEQSKASNATVPELKTEQAIYGEQTLIYSRKPGEWESHWQARFDQTSSFDERVQLDHEYKKRQEIIEHYADFQSTLDRQRPQPDDHQWDAQWAKKWGNSSWENKVKLSQEFLDRAEQSRRHNHEPSTDLNILLAAEQKRAGQSQAERRKKQQQQQQQQRRQSHEQDQGWRR